MAAGVHRTRLGGTLLREFQWGRLLYRVARGENFGGVVYDNLMIGRFR